MTNQQEKALDYIEEIIHSMRDASFRCKEFSILICSAFLTVFATVNPNPKIMVILCAPVLLLFWLIDSFYLHKERIFRSEFKRIASMTDKEAEANNPLLFSAKIKKTKAFGSYIKSVFASVSTCALYLPLLAASIGFGIYVLKCC